MLNTTGNAALKVTALYLIISLLWILLSDRAVLALSADARGLAVLQTLKGWLFVMVTGTGLYVLLRRSYGQIENRLRELQRQQAALGESERRYRSFIENTSEGVYSFEPEQPIPTGLPVEEQVRRLYRGRIVACNDAMARMYGHPRADALIGMDLKALHGDEVRPENIAFLSDWISTGYRIVGAESQEVDKDGNTLWFSNNVVGVIEDGRLARVWGTQTDITERRLAEIERDRVVADLEALNDQLDQRVRERTAELVAANRELESFTYAVSHDLRAPIRAIHGFQQALREDYGEKLPQGARDYLEEISVGAARMNALIEGLLELSRATQAEVQRSEVDLGQLARELHAQFVRLHPQRRVELRLGPGLTAVGDLRLLRTLLQNLLENAWKYTAGTEPAQIMLSRIDSAGVCYFCVEDNGVGFEPEFAHRLFEPFQRLHRQDEYPGIGIGLATAQRIVRRHGGDIAGCGRPYGGARFCFTLGPGPSEDR